jgi:hypothetical protein
MQQPQNQTDKQETLAREIEIIVARELEPVRRELALVREYVKALAAAQEPW